MPNTDNDRLAKTLRFETLEVRFGYARAKNRRRRMERGSFRVGTALFG